MIEPWAPWASSAEAVLEALGARPTGLTGAEAARRLRAYGPNLLRTKRPRSAWAILVAQIQNVIVALLGLAALAAFALGHPVEGSAIAGVLVLNTVIGFTMELRATRSMEALRHLGRVRATVRRDGALSVVAADHVVPGDIIVVEAGDVITTDARIVAGSKLAADESILTGESRPVSKSAASVSESARVFERSSMLFKGTVVTRGSGEAVVVATGMNSELGKIARLIDEPKDEETPLEQRLGLLGKRLIWLTGLVVVGVAAMGVYRGRDPLLVISTAIALAVATVPEGLPVVATLALARGMWKMARRHALVRRLAAVETLGSTSVIMTDKTGTLTLNRASVSRVVVEGGTHRRRDDGSFDIDPAEAPLLYRALVTGALCNNAELSSGIGVGEPLEAALVEAAATAGIDADVEARYPELREEPFDPETRMMATFHRAPAESGAPSVLVAVKGAVEPVLRACTAVATPEGPVPLDEPGRAAWLEQHELLAGAGLRVLAVADKRVHAPTAPAYRDLTLIGLIGMEDPPRRDVSRVIEECRRAGIHVVMVTGDHPATATRVAQAVGLAPASARVVTGDELEHGPEPSPSEPAVYARTSPQQKLELIRRRRREGRIVAMIGDGVNDAPALHEADIGVAMGGRGTQVAKEAADMVLLDDQLDSIVIAIREGRAIFDNIRRFVVYLLSCNVSELLVVGTASLVGLPLPVLPMQILFLNLVTDVFPALALGACPPEPGVMARPPRPPLEPTLTRAHWRAIGAHGVVLMTTVLGSLWIALGALGLDERRAVTVSFATLGLAQTLHVLNMRGQSSGIFVNEVTKNRWVWGAIALCIALILGAVLLPGLRDVLGAATPGAAGWLVVAVMSVLPVGVSEIVEAVRKAARSRRAHRRTSVDVDAPSAE